MSRSTRVSGAGGERDPKRKPQISNVTGEDAAGVGHHCSHRGTDDDGCPCHAQAAGRWLERMDAAAVGGDAHAATDIRADADRGAPADPRTIVLGGDERKIRLRWLGVAPNSPPGLGMSPLRDAGRRGAPFAPVPGRPAKWRRFGDAWKRVASDRPQLFTRGMSWTALVKMVFGGETTKANSPAL